MIWTCFALILCSTVQQAALGQCTDSLHLFTQHFQLLATQSSDFTVLVCINCDIKFWQRLNALPVVAPPGVRQAALQPKVALLQHHNHFTMELPNASVHCEGVPNPSAGPRSAKSAEAAINIQPMRRILRFCSLLSTHRKRLL